MAEFRFRDIEIWQLAVEIGYQLFILLTTLKLYCFADRTRGTVLAISNNIAEGSGPRSKKDFAQFLNIANRSCLEDASNANRVPVTRSNMQRSQEQLLGETG